MSQCSLRTNVFFSMYRWHTEPTFWKIRRDSLSFFLEAPRRKTGQWALLLERGIWVFCRKSWIWTSEASLPAYEEQYQGPHVPAAAGRHENVRPGNFLILSGHLFCVQVSRGPSRNPEVPQNVSNYLIWRIYKIENCGCRCHFHKIGVFIKIWSSVLHWILEFSRKFHVEWCSQNIDFLKIRTFRRMTFVSICSVVLLMIRFVIFCLIH